MKLLATTAVVLALTSTSAFAWTDQNGHWQEGPAIYGYTYPHPDYNPPPYYGHPLPPPYSYGPPVYGYGVPAPRFDFSIGRHGFYFGIGR